MTSISFSFISMSRFRFETKFAMQENGYDDTINLQQLPYGKPF